MKHFFADIATATAHQAGRPIAFLFAVLIIMTVYVPILTFQRIEGRLFRPMAITIAFAVVGALILTLTLLPERTDHVHRISDSRKGHEHHRHQQHGRRE